MPKTRSTTTFYFPKSMTKDQKKAEEVLSLVKNKKLDLLTWLVTLAERMYGLDDISLLSREQLQELMVTEPSIESNRLISEMLNKQNEILAILKNGQMNEKPVSEEIVSELKTDTNAVLPEKSTKENITEESPDISEKQLALLKAGMDDWDSL